MWRRLLIISTAALSVIAIKVPVDNTEIEATELIPLEVLDDNLKKPIYYLPDDGKSDSFLIPPHQLEEIEVSGPLVTPATYLLPPAPGKHIDYYYRPEEQEQTDWYPIASNQKKQPETTQTQEDESDSQTDTKYRNGKVLQESPVNVPQRNLLPPTANAQNDFIILAPSAELELPNENVDEPTNIPQVPREVFTKIRPQYIHPKIIPIPYLMPPKNIPPKYYPTKLYPKKFVNEFEPVPIPINQYADEHVDKVPMARPARPFHPVVNDDGQYEIPEDKQVYSYEKAENQRKLQAPEDTEPHQHVASPSKDASSEQEASESNFGQPSRNAYPAPLKQAPPVAPSKYASANGERTEFRMHGMKGPHSYQFGYDTGKGKNRQFRYEERDNDGHVKGHYGYVDKHGKLRVVNYDADPEHGFRAEAPVETE